jgi:MFS family permease
MFERLDAAQSLTANQWRIVAAAILGDMLEFFDYFLIGFVLAFIIGPWQLTFGQSAIILLSSGIGAILGAAVWGRLADRIGRRAVFIGTVLNFSLATGVLALTPDHGWIFLTVFRFFVGFGVGGLYCVDLPLVQEFVPSSKRGFVGGLVTAFIPLGVMIGSLLGAFLAPAIGWRGLFACGLVPALLCLLIRAWVPESPRWLVRMGRLEEARRSVAWALQVPPESLPLPVTQESVSQQAPCRSVSLSAQPAGLVAQQSWHADDRLRCHFVGANAVRPPTRRIAGRSLVPVRVRQHRRLCGAVGFFVSLRSDWPPGSGCAAGVRQRRDGNQRGALA